jgi:hypothetical protein
LWAILLVSLAIILVFLTSLPFMGNVSRALSDSGGFCNFSDKEGSGGSGLMLLICPFLWFGELLEWSCFIVYLSACGAGFYGIYYYLQATGADEERRSLKTHMTPERTAWTLVTVLAFVSVVAMGMRDGLR